MTEQNSTIRILGVNVGRYSRAEAMARIRELIVRRGTAVVYFVNAHCINQACNVPGYREVLNGADLLLNDGSGLNWAARRQGRSFIENCVGTDFIPMLCRETLPDGFSFYLLGGREGIARRAAENWRRTYPGIKIAGIHHGYIENNRGEEDRVIEEINNSGADVLLVAMGMPRQEQWISRNRGRLKVGACFAVGALFDFAAGAVPRAPQWMLDRGLEWVFRLMTEPRRLWKRYIIGNPLFLARVLGERLRARLASPARQAGRGRT